MSELAPELAVPTADNNEPIQSQPTLTEATQTALKPEAETENLQSAETKAEKVETTTTDAQSETEKNSDTVRARRTRRANNFISSNPLVAKSKFVKPSSNQTKNATQHSHMEIPVSISSPQLGYYLSKYQNSMMNAAFHFTGLLVICSKEQDQSEIISTWLSGINERHKEFINGYNAELDDILKSNEAISDRLNLLVQRTPDVYMFAFSHPFFWTFIDLIKTTDAVLTRLEQLSLIGIIDQEYKAMADEQLLNYITGVFKALSTVARVKRRNVRLSDTRTKLSTDRLKTVIESLEVQLKTMID
ncbi:hypothetical protein LRP52_23865 [Photobacterium sp. ZSDE20]|uniref:Uncharacterized protein n=1 Tax=Photobacterium pectinilyticum TaxID=2906793 RepID=A0ABT1N3V4_9GAMM|nr:hypothetical protein [Photobacterium sp. ZSDE20]MCQ1058406.1 hypothetical protein [Photobacterium sp. ZSDE20]MDD1825231.1 hypothetical protein [Photobacterium sp. ZSDE20]